MTQAYPLHWPQHKLRSRNREKSRFNVTFTAARNELFAELNRLNCRNTVVSTNIALRQDGIPYAGEKEPSDPGVAVYFLWKGQQMSFACDRWDKVRDNMRAIAKTIEAIRGIDRWGSGDMLQAAFSGFVALEPPKGWRKILEIELLNPTLAFIEDQYRILARRYHPDTPGGSHEKMAELNAAIEQARRELA